MAQFSCGIADTEAFSDDPSPPWPVEAMQVHLAAVRRLFGTANGADAEKTIAFRFACAHEWTNFAAPARCRLVPPGR